MKICVNGIEQNTTPQSDGIAKTERWYDRHTRLWVLEYQNASGHQIGIAIIDTKEATARLERQFRDTGYVCDCSAPVSATNTKKIQLPFVPLCQLLKVFHVAHPATIRFNEQLFTVDKVDDDKLLCIECWIVDDHMVFNCVDQITYNQLNDEWAHD